MRSLLQGAPPSQVPNSWGMEGHWPERRLRGERVFPEPPEGTGPADAGFRPSHAGFRLLASRAVSDCISVAWSPQRVLLRECESQGIQGSVPGATDQTPSPGDAQSPAAAAGDPGEGPCSDAALSLLVSAGGLPRESLPPSVHTNTGVGGSWHCTLPTPLQNPSHTSSDLP